MNARSDRSQLHRIKMHGIHKLWLYKECKDFQFF